MSKIFIRVKIIITILIVVSMLFSILTYAGEKAWVYVTESENNLWFIDTEAITCQGDICRAWVKVPSIGEGKYMISFYEFNCAGAEYRILHTTEYDSYGNIISKFLPTKAERMGIVPESIDEKLSKFVCQKVGLDKEQKNEGRKYGEAVTEEKLVRGKEGEKVEKSGLFTVQVGAFRNASYAQGLAARLEGKGYKVYITSLENKDGVLYKVRVGKFTNRQEAENLSGEIKKTEGLHTFITLF